MDVIEKLFSDLESNNLQLAEESKKRLYDYFSQISSKESWLVNGMMDYFSQTNSSRIVDVLVKVQPPHDKFIFDRMSEWLQHISHRNQSITLFGHIVKKHPSWLYKVASHPFLRDILKLLKSDTNIITAMNALFCIIILLPIIPTAMPQYLNDLFDIFQYLATWNCNHQPRLTEDQSIHLQIGLSAYFQRLYGMYPCNFVAYLRDHVMKEHAAVFVHTIRPLLETVKMHPALLTSNRELEKANSRWKEMEPHDVVVECSRFALDYQTRCAAAAGRGDGAAGSVTSRSAVVGLAGEMLAAAGGVAAISDCPYYKMMSGRAIVETPISQQLRRLLKSTPSQASSLCSPFYSPFSEPNESATEPQRIDNMWSPLWSVMATPPPTLSGGTVAPPTPTPSLSSGVLVSAIKPISTAIPASVSHLPPQQQQQQQLQQLCVSGSSPPEAAVEATPETTPMKELVSTLARPFPVNSPAVRAIWGTSQPTSPLRRDALTAAAAAAAAAGSSGGGAGPAATFRFNMIEAGAAAASAVGIGATGTVASTLAAAALPISSPKILNLVNERNMYASQLREDQHIAAAAAAESTAPAANSSNNNVRDDVRSAAATALTSDTTPEDAEVTQINSLVRPPLPPQSRFKRSPNGNTDRSSAPSKTADGVPPASDADEDSAAASAGEDDIGADGENGNSPTQKIFSRRLQSKRSHFARKIDRITIGTQTIQQLPQTYEQIFLELLAGTADAMPAVKNAPESDADVAPPHSGSAVVPAVHVPLSSHALLDQLIETAVRKKPTGGGGSSAVEQIQLLNLQLQYERYRREVHAERNRRLLGKSRANASLEMDNEKLREQREKLAAEVDELTQALNRARVMRTAQENEHSAEVQRLQRDVHAERALGAELRSHVESLQRSVADERRQRQEAIGALAACKAELFDMRNELAQTQERAEWGVRCREELQRLQHEVLLMGEIQVKCRERLAEVNGWQTREAEAALVRTAYAEEVKDIRTTLDIKTAQLDAARTRLAELEAQLSRRDSMFTEQKRLLKTVKEEYEDRFKALEAKYTAQKAIILRMEEEMLDLYHRSGTSGAGAQGGSAQQTPDADRQSVVGSLDPASPLSVSLASSEGIAMSLRATATEIRNLHPLVVAPHVAAAAAATTSTIAAVAAGSGAPINQQPGTSSSSSSNPNESVVVVGVHEIGNNSVTHRQPVSEDIPVPVASSNPLHIQRSGLHHQHPHHPLNKHHPL